MPIGFEADIYEKRKRIERYIGKYYTFYTANQSYSGKIKEITEDKIILNPRQGIILNKEKNLEKAVIKEDEEIEKDSIISRGKTSLKIIEADCREFNKKNSKKGIKEI